MQDDTICAVDLIPSGLSGGVAQYRVDVTTLRPDIEIEHLNSFAMDFAVAVERPTYRNVTETIYAGDDYADALAATERWAAKMNAQRTPPAAPQEPLS